MGALSANMFQSTIVFVTICLVTLYARTELRVDRIQCETTLGICQPLFCNITKPNRNVQLLSVECYSPVPLTDIRIHVQLFRRYNQYRPIMLNLEMDLCDYLSYKGNRNLFAGVILPHFMKYTNFNRSCPLEGSLRVDGLQLDLKFLDSFPLPPGHHRVDVRIYNGGTNESIVFVRVYSEMFTNYNE